METKFTKGTWYPVNYAGFWVIQPSKYYQTAKIKETVNIFDSREVGETTAKFNALLASKAPELLSTLNGSIDLLKKAIAGMANYEQCIAMIERSEKLLLEATIINKS